MDPHLVLRLHHFLLDDRRLRGDVHRFRLNERQGRSKGQPALLLLDGFAPAPRQASDEGLEFICPERAAELGSLALDLIAPVEEQLTQLVELLLGVVLALGAPKDLGE